MELAPWHFKIPLIIAIFPLVGLALLAIAIWRALGGSEGLAELGYHAGRRLTEQQRFESYLSPKERAALGLEPRP